MAFTFPASAQDKIREIFVPFEDLNVILESDIQRVFLTRQEYEALIEKAAAKPQRKVPLSAAVVAAEYTARLQEGRALIEGKLQIDVLEPDLVAIPLDLAGVGIRAAILDDEPAALARNDSGHVILFVQGAGKHVLTLSLTAPLATSAATQTLQATLPVTAATKLALTVPGNVEVRAGASVISRSFDEAANATALELLPQRGPMGIVLSLNNKTLQEQRVVLASSVLVTEVTQGYERLHATVSHRVLHGAVDKLRLVLPDGFEVTRVVSPHLARWEVQEDAKPAVLEAILREPTTEPIVLQITATRSPPKLENWSLPRLVPLDVAGQVAVVSLLVEDRFDPQRIATQGLIPVDADTLAAAIPRSVFQAEPGAPTVRQTVSYYAPSGDYQLTAEFARPPAEVHVASSGLLTLAEKELRYSGTLLITPQAEDLFDFRLEVPSPWEATEVAKADGTPLSWERYEQPAAVGALPATRLHVRIPGGIKAGEQLAVRFQAASAPAGWLADWQTQRVDFPQFTIDGASRDSGLIGVKVQDDLAVRPERAEGLVPLPDAERAQLTGGQEQVSLAYRFEQRPFSLRLLAERIAPSLAAEVYCYLTVAADHLEAAYELHFAVRDARTQKLQFSLPAGTPAELDIQEIDPANPQQRIKIKEATSRIEGERRIWTVHLAERKAGQTWLSATFQQRFERAEPKGLRLPLAQAEQVDHQSVLVGIEGESDLDIQVKRHPRAVDVGELQGNVAYEVTQRLIGAFGYVGNEGEENQVVVDVVRRKQHGLPAAFVERAELVTRVSQSGRSQSVARYDLKTKATLIEIELPADADLWTIFLDGQPTKPQKENGRLLVSLPAESQATARTLQIVYETQQTPLRMAGRIEADAPRLLLRASAGDEGAVIPQVKLQWTLVLPSGYMIRRAGGTVFTTELPSRELAAVKAGRWLWDLLQTPISPFYYRQAGREMSSGNHVRQWPGTDNAPQTAVGPDVVVLGDESASMTPPPESAPEPAEMAKLNMQAARDSMSAREAEEMDGMKRDLAMEKAARRSAVSGERLRSAPELTELAQTAEPRADQPGPSGRGEQAQAAQQAETGAGRRWAEQGLASLVIDFQEDRHAPSMTFRSLGIEPRLRALAVETRRIEAAAWGLGMLVFLVGVGLTAQPVRRKFAYVFGVMLAATLPLLVTSRLDEIALVFDFMFYAAALLLPYYLAAAVVLAAWSRLKALALKWFLEEAALDAAAPSAAAKSAVSVSGLLLALVLGLGANAVQAQQPVDVTSLRELLPVLDPGGPVAVPKDAIIIPYDAAKPEGLAEAEKVLVPYEKYVELWNRANPDQRLNGKSPPAPFALAGASYQATLSDGKELIVSGRIEIDVFTDKPVVVPLNLVGGVLVRATLDGQPARIQSVQPQPVSLAAGGSGAEAAKPATPGGEAVMLLHASGKGRKNLELTIRLGLARQGGWRLVSGRLPAAPATALTLTVPQEQTEVRLSGLPDKGVFESTKANDPIETALPADGSLALSWRPKVTEGMVDQSLTAQSAAVIDVRDDAVRMVWQVALEFGRGTRDAFQFNLPLGYLVEQVSGENVRGFAVKEESGRQSLHVTLLKGATGKETLTFHVSQRGVVGQGELAQFAAPEVRVEAAVLHQGTIAIRRSTRLDLRAVTVADLGRADAGGETANVAQLADAAETSFVPLQPFQTYRFAREGFKLTLAARPLAQATTALVRAVVRAGERESSLDAAILYRVQGAPLYRALIYLPDGFELERLLPAGVEWSVTAEEVDQDGAKTKRQLLTVHLQRGQTGDFQLALLGELPPRAVADQVTAPQMEILDVARQEGEIVFLPEPDTDIAPIALSGLERIGAMESFAWLKPEQRELAKYALRYRSSGYSGTLRLRPRTPRITATTLTNVRITPKAIEETLLFRFLVQDAGVRELAVILPEYFSKARLPADLAAKVQQKIVEPATDNAGNPLPGRIRVRFVLPEHQQGQIDLGLLYDRLLTPEKQRAAIPEVPAAATARRLIVIENIGRDEVVTEGSDALEPIAPGQQAYEELLSILPGGRITQAYLVSPGADAPQLAFHLDRREQAAAAGATIGLARAWLTVDAFGAYRGVVEFNIKNETEQYLEVLLPPSGQLWTAIVRGTAVKPVEPAGNRPGIALIPLVKAALGEGDYQVVLKYGGRLGDIRELTQVRFPLITTANIQVQQSQVRLYLPQSHQWFDFGGTMKQVNDGGELELGFQKYFYKQLEETKQLLSGADDYTRARAMNNLKQLEGKWSRTKSQFGERYDDELTRRNDELLAEASELAEQQQARQEDRFEDNNRQQLFGLWRGQKQDRSKNVVGNLGSNFDQLEKALDPMQLDGKPGYNADWFAQNKLATDGQMPARAADPRSATPDDPNLPQSRVTLGKKSAGAEAGEEPQEPQLYDYAVPAKPNAPAAEMPAPQAGFGGQAQLEQQNFRRYQQRLEQKQEQLQQQNETRELAGPPLAARQGQGGGQFGAFEANSAADTQPGGLPGMPPTEGTPMTDPDVRRPGTDDVGGGGRSDGAVIAGEGRAVASIAGLASLNVAIPQDGVEYLFTTPRGNMRITARPVSQSLLTRLWGLGGVIGAVALVWIATRPRLLRMYKVIAGTLAFAVALIVIGLASILLGILPLAGLVALIAGASLLIGRRIAVHRPVAST